LVAWLLCASFLTRVASLCVSVSAPPPVLHSFPTRRSSDLLHRASFHGRLGILRGNLGSRGLRRLGGHCLRRLSRRSLSGSGGLRSEEHTSELQSRENLVCRLLLEKKKTRPGRRGDTTLRRN